MVKDIKELMKPRYKVIGSYPGSNFEVGDIITLDKVNEDERINKGVYFCYHGAYGPCAEYDLSPYPHLFQPLQWWEERAVNEMPVYMKFSDDKNTSLSIGGEKEPEFHKVKHHWTSSPRMDFHSSAFNCFISEWKNHCYSYAQFVPITADEYQSYLTTVTKT